VKSLRAIHRPAFYIVPTPRCSGWLVALAAVVAASAIWAWLDLVAWATLAALGSLLIVDLAAGPRRRDVTVERIADGHFALGVPGRLSYAVTNRARVGIRVEIVDTPVEKLRFPERPASGVVGASRVRRLDLSVTPLRRGPATLGSLYVRAVNAIGLCERRWRIAAESAIRIFPDLSAVQRYGELARRRRLTEAGFRRLRLRGLGGEFDSIREWTPDDEFRSIDWKATARRGKVMVDQYRVERSQTVMVILDAGRLMTPRLGGLRKFDYAIAAALSVCGLASLAGDRIGLLAFASDVVEHIPARSGAAHMRGLTDRVYDLEPRFEEADYARAFTYFARRQSKRSLAIFFTDIFDPVASAATLANLFRLTPRHLAVCVLVNDAAVQHALETEPLTLREAYEAGVAAELAVARRTTAALLAQRGIIVIDVPASQLSVALINAYVDVKSRNLL
jgi:uncharacterized protein (DUF58 family)